MRCIVCSLLLILNAFYADAQKPPTTQPIDTSYHLLWYKGKKIKPNVLLTPTQDTVFYAPAKRTVKVASKTGQGRRLDKMQAELKRTPQRMSEMMKSLASAMPKTVAPYYAAPLKAAYDQVQGDFSGALSSTITIPEITIDSIQITSPSEGQATKGPNMDDVAETADPYEKPMKEVLAYYEKHKNEAITYVPTPPRNEYTYCSSCETNAEARFQSEFEIFRKELLGEDERMMQMVLGLMRHAELGVTPTPRDEMHALLYPIMVWLIDRSDRKARILIEKYIDDPARVRTVTIIGLSVERTQQLLGLSKNDGFYLDAFLRGQKALANMIETAIKEYDYSIALNIQTMLTVERQFQLLGSDVPRMNIYEMLNFNQFKMNVDLSAKISGDGGFQLAHLRGDNWFAAVPDENCKLKWILMGPNKDYLKVKVIAADIQGSGVRLEHVGTTDWSATKPLLRLEFCAKEKDTVEIFSFHASDFKESWLYPQVGVQTVLHMDAVLIGCFMDVERAKQKAEKFKNPENIEKMKQQMMQQYQQFMKSGGKDMANGGAAQMSPQDVQKMMAMAKTLQAGDKLIETVQSPTVISYLMHPTAQNKSRQIFKQSLNGKEVFPQNIATEYAWLHVTFEQDPNSPYKGSSLLNN